MSKTPISENLRSLRESLNISKAEMSRRIGIPYTTYNGYEEGLREPKYDVLQKIATALGINPGILLGYAVNDIYLGDVKYFNVTLKYYRTKYHYSQDELNSKLNLPDKLIYQLEKGEISPSDELLEKLASFFNIHYKDLLDDYFGTIYKRILRVIAKSKLSSNEFWDRLDVSNEMYENWENKISKSYLLFIERISKDYDVPLDFLFGDTDISLFPGYSEKSSYNDDELKLIECYRMLNLTGREEAIKRIEELSYLEKYLN